MREALWGFEDVYDPMTPAALEARWGRQDAIRFEERLGGTVAVLSAAGATAAISLQGAQVLSYVPAGHEDLLWLSPLARIKPGKSIRGGIPICWPWFGPHASDDREPAHGFVRMLPWRVTGSASGAGRARLVMAINTGDLVPPRFPQRAFAEVEVTLDQTLTVSLTTENRDEAPLALTEALHSYFKIADIEGISVHGLERRPYFDKLTLCDEAGGAEPVSIGAEIDRIYLETSDTVRIEDRRLARRIRVAKQGSRSTVLWNPWIAKMLRLGDMGEDGYRHMVCVETANAGKDVVTLAPGARHRLVTQISAEFLR